MKMLTKLNTNTFKKSNDNQQRYNPMLTERHKIQW